MPFRFVAGLLAMMLLVTSAVTGSASYLCRAQGKAHASPCCAQTKARETPYAKLQAANNCCELRAISHEQVPATLEGTSLPSSSALVLPLRIEPVFTRVPPLPSLDGQPAPSACGPPRTGPPVALFIRHCRYLI